MRTIFGVMMVASLGLGCGGAELAARSDRATPGPSTPNAPATPVVSAAQVALGGALYDKWWKVAKVAEPAGDHPLWASRPDTETNKRTGATTFRCKECHGWDYRGSAGAYSSGSHHTGFPGVMGAAKLPAAQLHALIKTQHGYGALGLSDAKIDALVAFLQHGLLDTRRFIDEAKSFTGEAALGKVFYDAKIATNLSCASCHGPEGKKPPKGHPDFDDYPGMLARKNPWEFLHKVRFGQPGTTMPRGHGKATLGDFVNLGAYAQTIGH